MKTPNQDKTAASEGAGNDEINIADAWLAWLEGHDAAGGFGQAISEALRGSVTARAVKRWGPLPPDLLEDIRQDAAVRLIGDYLPRNRDLEKATAARDARRITQQIARSIRGAAKVAVLKAMDKAARESKRRLLLVKAAENGTLPGVDGVTHPIPREQAMALALAALAVALKRDLMPQARAALIKEVLAGKPPAQAARERGVSRAAISQQMTKAARLLGRLIERGEVEL